MCGLGGLGCCERTDIVFRFYERSNTLYNTGDMVCWFVCDGPWCPLWVVSPRSEWTVSLGQTG